MVRVQFVCPNSHTPSLPHSTWCCLGIPAEWCGFRSSSNVDCDDVEAVSLSVYPRTWAAFYTLLRRFCASTCVSHMVDAFSLSVLLTEGAPSHADHLSVTLAVIDLWPCMVLLFRSALAWCATTHDRRSFLCVHWGHDFYFGGSLFALTLTQVWIAVRGICFGVYLLFVNCLNFIDWVITTKPYPCLSSIY